MAENQNRNNKGTSNGKYPGWLRILIILAVLLLGGTGGYTQFTGSSTESEQVSTSAPSTETTEEYGEKSSGLSFRNQRLLEEHFEKHGKEMGFASAAEYEQAAAAVVENPSALHKTEKEDGDDVYYLEKTNEFVIVSTDGFLRTYFSPENGIRYYNKQ